ncbi:MAG: D-aminoacylase [Candidatus Omnitrophica bacterium]|nr:D-aminoacylase [Candidatus Omnitrophota bacterium]
MPYLKHLFIFALLFLWGGAFPSQAEEKPYDYVIKDVLVFDGESLLPKKQDLAISRDRIIRIGKVSEKEGNQVIHAEGLIASPGFIDIHTHSDFNPFVYANLGNKVLQGVTTEVIGNCGMSAAPVMGYHESQIADVWKREGVGIPTPLSWKSFEEYKSEAEFQGLETNLVSLVGHGNLRSIVLGADSRKATPTELDRMRTLFDEALDEGAWGISFGLVYIPGIFSDREEIVTLCREAGRKNGICAFHMRSEGKELLEAIQEVIDIAKETGAPCHISHLKAAGKQNWPKITEAFQKIEEAQKQSLKITADVYPYTASFAELGVILPDDLYKDPERTQRFRDSKQRGKILRTLRKHYEKNPVNWENIRIATVSTDKNGWMQAKTLLVISETFKKPPIETLIDILRDEEFKVSAFYFSQSEEVVSQVLSKPYVAIGSDSIADGSAMPHPRAYGTFPKLLAQCPRDTTKGGRCWGSAIHQMTGLPAKILGLKERGRIQPGFFADLVLFDPLTVQDKADYDNPKTMPEGIEWVFVNGKAVVQEGKYEPVHSGLFVEAERTYK